MKRFVILLLALSLLFASCGAKSDNKDTAATTAVTETETETAEAATTAEATESVDAGPATSDELAASLLEAWKGGDVSEFYDSLSSDMAYIFDADGLSSYFGNLTDVFGAVEDFEKTKATTVSGYDVLTYKVKTGHADIDMTVSVKNMKIAGIDQNIRFTDTIDKPYENGVTERYFLIKCGEYELNAVYTFSGRESAPAVLLIPGSGSSDCNENVGLLEPFRDIALGLADRGVNSLRLEKRTFRYPETFTDEDGLDEEYFEDFTAALEWLKDQMETDKVYLLGHSLGGQIAAVMAKDADVAGVICFNSMARHIADVLYDQFCILDPSNEQVYLRYAAAAKAVDADHAKGQKYFDLSDHYWVSYNAIDVTGSLKSSGVPVLIINSKNDNNLFDADLDLWQSELGEDENVTIKVYDDMSHFGYRIDTNDPTAIYRHADFPEELLNDFAGFCK